ncbi:MAG: hypothetical protein A2Z29_09175 [Chloroflexi bacterium RBG_16_56_11]|nr:MAG: hypothetical protein A2Z29_09175 [Chloroflexi bacterium RBG_16_56_11]
MWQVIGQARAVSLLEHGLASDRLAHAYLFAGPPHVGKMTLAVNLAQALNCQAPVRPCLQCVPCQKIAAGGHADVQVIGLLQDGDTAGAKLIGIDQVKQVQHSASLPPFEGKNRVYIIDGAELLSTEAANCLLKTLEEPNGAVTFILLTVNDRLLPATVVSRCQRLELRPVSIDEEQAALVEKRGMDRGRARLLAGLSHGCPGWAVTAASDDSLLGQREEELKRLLAAMKGDIEERFTCAARMAERFGQSRSAVYNVLELWLDFWRDLMLVKLGCEKIIRNTDRNNELVELAGRYALAPIRSFISSLQSAAVHLGQNVNPRLALEVLMLDMPT